jgi:hypothetical protein
MFRIFFTDGSRSTQIPKGAVVWELLVALVYFLVGGYLLSHLTTFAVTSVNSLFCHVSTCFRIGSKFLCIRSTPTAMQSMSENDFECFASTGLNTPGTMLPNFWVRRFNFPQADFWTTSSGSA